LEEATDVYEYFSVSIYIASAA